MVSDNGARRDGDIHGTAFIAGLAVSAGGNISFDLKDPKQVEYSQNSPVRTGILAERPFYQKGCCQYQSQDHQSRYGHLSGPEVEQGKVGIIKGRKKSGKKQKKYSQIT